MFQNNYCIYHNFLAVSRSKELYTTYSKLNEVECRHTCEFFLCPEISPLRNTKSICEILLDPKRVLEN